MSALVFHREAHPLQMRLPAANAARYVQVGAHPFVAFKDAAGADLSVESWLGTARGFVASLATKLTIRVFTPATTGQHQFRAAIAAVKAGESLAGGPTYSGTTVDFAATAPPGTANQLQIVTVTLPSNALDSLAADDLLCVKLTLLDATSTLGQDIYVASIEVSQEA